MQKIRNNIYYYLPSIIAILVLMVIWHFSVIVFDVKEYVFPAPDDTLMTLFDPKYRWISNTLITFYAVAGAFVISTVLGIVLAIIVIWHPLLERTVMPLLVLFNTLPKVALAPLFVLWLGYGVVPNMLIAVTVSFFPMVINTAAGLTQVDRDLIDLVRSLKGTKRQIFSLIRLPNALPYIFAGLKLNATLSVIGAIVGEFVASEGGLGALIIIGGVTLDTPAIFASLCIISAMGLALYVLVVIAERIFVPWETSEVQP
ncbi:ABC transporter permease [Sneathiella litorea]|uniref:ABC transporter permease subunit n=1 Tax=Sneathiella litorea TaxID=2606216 RepID=A0A6L8W6C5_9PROT|nr:ABC transporter permease [Sneathiella litorea]MZR30696.1 ABC transporter permease subunit [Sneathiella litorea]